MEPYYSDDRCQLHLGDCLDLLPALPGASVDAVICDPPYELGFLGRAWDSSGIAYDTRVWRECLRTLKPGGHLLAFGATRTYHRLACAIEDAGFEIRDSIHWIYGNGFPKGQDVGKRIDKMRDDRDGILAVTAYLAAARKTAGLTNKNIDAEFGFNGMANHWTTSGMTAQVPSVEAWERLRGIIGFDHSMDAEVRRLNERKGTIGEAWSRREVVGHRHAGLGEGKDSVFLKSSAQVPNDGLIPVTAPATAAAQAWDGWHTTLKPSHEPIVVARKPTGFNSTVANVLKHGTGALNIGACRIEAVDADYAHNASGDRGHSDNRKRRMEFTHTAGRSNNAGRWPTNVVFAHDPNCADICATGCPVAQLDTDGGVRTSGANPARRASDKFRDVYGDFAGQAECIPARGADSGGASRFFPAFRYQAKASDGERPQLAPKKAMRLREDLTGEQRAYVLAELMKAGVDVA